MFDFKNFLWGKNFTIALISIQRKKFQISTHSEVSLVHVYLIYDTLYIILISNWDPQCGYHVATISAKDVFAKLAFSVCDFVLTVWLGISTPNTLVHLQERYLVPWFLPACKCMQHTLVFFIKSVQNVNPFLKLVGLLQSWQHNIHTAVNDGFTYGNTVHAGDHSALLP